MLKKIWYGFLMTIGALTWVVIALIWYNSEPASEEEKAASAAASELNSFKIFARASCSSAISEMLRNPSSVEWDRRSSWPIIEDGEGLYTVIMKYRAENGFGGMNQETRQCLVVRSGEQATVLGIE